MLRCRLELEHCNEVEMKRHVLERRGHVGWGGERFVPFGSALVGTPSAENPVLFDTLGVVFILAWGTFCDGEEGVHPISLKFSTRPSDCFSSLPFLFFSAVLFLGFVFSSIPPFRLTSHPDGPAGNSSACSFHLLSTSSLCRCPFF